MMLVLAAAFPATNVDARRSKPPVGTLTLPFDAPIIVVTIADTELRLRVAPDQKRVIELNPAAAQRLKLPFEGGIEDMVGRETVKGITGAAQVRLDGRTFMAQILSHERDCCRDVDGEIGITLLPYATVRLVRDHVAVDLPQRHYLIEDSDERGPETRLRIGKTDMFAAFSITRPQSVATYSAGVVLATAYGGKLAPGPATTIEAAFGVIRPIRHLHLARPANVAGFAFDSLQVRISDFGGRYDFKTDDALPDDIVVKRRISPQEAWPLVLIGRDRLDRCGELRFDIATKIMTLACAFAGKP